MLNVFRNDGELPATIAKQLERKSKSPLDPDLAYALDFTAGDLIANRMGLMSIRQVDVLRRFERELSPQCVSDVLAMLAIPVFFIIVPPLAHGYIPGGLEWVGIMVLAISMLLGFLHLGRVMLYWIPLVMLIGEVIFFVALIAKILANPPKDLDWFVVFLGIGLYTLPTLGALSFGNITRSSIVLVDQDIQSGKVASRSGRVVLAGDIVIGNESFKVSGAACLRIKHLDYYTLYYVPRTRIVLSAEPVV